MFRRRYQNSVGIVVLALIAGVSVVLGDGLGAAMTIMAVLAWVVAIVMIVYMVLIRGMTFSLFGGRDEDVEAGAVEQFDVEAHPVKVE